MENLPLDLTNEIFLRLPVKSVLQCKRVCKTWRFLISDPKFRISHYGLAAAPSHRLVFKSHGLLVNSIDVDAPLFLNSAELNFLFTPPSPPHGDAHHHNDKCMIFGSYRGILLLYFEFQQNLILWNPSIGVHQRLTYFDFDLATLNIYSYGFGYDTSTNNHCLVLIVFEESENDDDDDYDDDDYECSIGIRVFSFESASSVTYNDVCFPYDYLNHKFIAGLFFNDALHWLVWTQDECVPVIITFDLIQRSLSDIIPLFDHFTVEKCKVHSFGVMGGCLCVCCSVQGCATAEIWMMKEYKVQSSWTKYMVIPIHEFPDDHFCPICITKDGQILGSNTGRRLEKRNHKGELLEFLTYGGGGDSCCFNLMSAMYRESLLLPSDIIGKPSEDDQW